MNKSTGDIHLLNRSFDNSMKIHTRITSKIYDLERKKWTRTQRIRAALRIVTMVFDRFSKDKFFLGVKNQKLSQTDLVWKSICNQPMRFLHRFGFGSDFDIRFLVSFFCLVSSLE